MTFNYASNLTSSQDDSELNNYLFMLFFRKVVSKLTLEELNFWDEDEAWEISKLWNAVFQAGTNSVVSIGYVW